MSTQPTDENNHVNESSDTDENINNEEQPMDDVPPVEASTESSTEQMIESMQAKLSDMQTQLDANQDQLVRGKAEIENMRRRAQRDVGNAHKFAVDKFVKEILPIWDSVELGLMAASADNADVTKIIEGNELTLKLFNDAMQKFNVALINPEGEIFNPEMHQAMSMVPNPEVPENTVLTVVQKGCTLNGRVLRPAMVMVSQVPK